ncbi:MAG: sigma-70 family RNA polymerase sigma factor, partial [bacterium]|nr:sigma-70 family RNA polymerase sigma factor [bacterium]
IADVRNGINRDAAWATLQEKYTGLIASIVRGRLKKEEDVNETISTVFTKAFLSLDQFNGGSFKAWLGTIARNTSINTIRGNKVTDRVSGVEDIDSYAISGEEAPKHDPEIKFLAIELGQRLWSAIDELSEAMRAVVIGIGIEERSYQEISDELDVPIGTIMSRYNRAKIKLREIIARQDATEKAA